MKQIIENRKYRLFCLPDQLKLYVIKKNGLFYIYGQYDYTNNGREFLWLNKSYRDFKLIWRKDYYGDNLFCYILLKDEYGRGIIMDVATKSVIIDNICFEDVSGAFKRRIEVRGERKEDVVLKILCRKNNRYILFSITYGIIFGPYSYKTIKEYRFGVILDDILAVEHNGEIKDLYNYENYDAPLYYNLDKNEYMVFLDEKGHLFYFLREMENEEEEEETEEKGKFLKLEFGNYEYVLNKNTMDFSIKKINDSSYIWTDSELEQATDIAYEGNSRLYLGLDD